MRGVRAGRMCAGAARARGGGAARHHEDVGATMLLCYYGTMARHHEDVGADAEAAAEEREEPIARQHVGRAAAR